jgi:acetyltransferase-like isoleucine patch superfamily enzyme
MGLFDKLIPRLGKRKSRHVPMNKDPRYQRYEIGEGSYGSPQILSWDSSTRLTIGKYCSFAGDVTIMLGGEHRADWVSTFPFNTFIEEWRNIKGHPTSKGDLVIGNDVWIGYGATILCGISIGDGAIIGARAVVTKNVEPYSIVAGNPAKLIKYRFEANTIKELLEIRWWDLPRDDIAALVPQLLSGDTANLIDRVRKLKVQE